MAELQHFEQVHYGWSFLDPPIAYDKDIRIARLNMEYIKGTCVNCNKEIQIPDDLNEIICMYCGHKMVIEEALTKAGADSRAIDEGLPVDFNMDEFAKVIDSDTPFNKIFNRDEYANYFQELYSQYEADFIAFSHQYIYCPEPKEDYIQRTAETIVRHETAKLDDLEKRKRKGQLYNDSAYVAIFIIPLIDYYKSEATDKLADAVVAAWRENFKDNQINRGNFDSINGGFKKRKFCYITTAVCNSLGKPDDCYELSVLRKFRDEWLALQVGGQELIDEYYDTAPVILRQIELSPKSEEVFDKLYKDYIAPCIAYIENDNYEQCKQLYLHMMKSLQRQWGGQEAFIPDLKIPAATR